MKKLVILAAIAALVPTIGFTQGLVVLNDQNNAGRPSASTSVMLSDVRLAAPSVRDNYLSAYSYGNVASNSIGLHNTSRPSAGIINQQYNTQSVRSTVTGVTITGTHIVSGNGVVAMAIGNSAVNQITSRR